MGTIIHLGAKGASPSVVAKPEPRGLFNLLPATDSSPSGGPGNVEDETAHPFWNMSYIAGSRYRIFWSQMEQSEGSYGWSTQNAYGGIDAYLDKCDAKSKLASISVSAGIQAPSWVISAGAASYSPTAPLNGTMSPPWDPVFQEKWLTFISAMGARYDSRSCLSFVVIGGLGQSCETYIAANSTDQAIIDGMAQSAGYADAATGWLAAANVIIPAYMAAFPTTTILITLARPVMNNISPPALNGDGALDQLVANMIPSQGTRFGLMNEGLNANSNTGFEINKLIHDHYTTNPAGFEPGATSSSESDLVATLNAGIALGAKFMETYEADTNNVAYATDLQNAVTGMLAN